MVKSYLVVSLALLAIVPFLVMDVAAQSIPTIPPPDGFPNTKTTSVYLATTSSNSTAKLAFGNAIRAHESVGQNRDAEMFIPANTRLLPNAALTDPRACNNSVKDLTSDSDAPDPSNIQSNQLNYSIGVDYTSVCSAYNSDRAEPFLTDKELRITIYGKHDNTPYYYSPYENVTVAQQIPACSTTNFDETDQTLKEGTEMCYGKNNNDMIIITKRFAGFYGAADTVAQSPLRLKAPASYSTSPTLLSISIISNTSNTTGYTVDGLGQFRTTYTHAVNSADAIGDLFLQHPVPILSNPFFSGINDESDPCGGIVASLAELPANNVPGFAIPDNIAPKTKSSLVGLGLNFHNGTSGPPCSPDPEALSSNPLITGKELRFTLYNQSSKSPYYFSPRDSILAAQPIPLCTTTNFNTTTQTLKGDNSMCSGKNGNHMIIITKRLFGFYGTADTVTTPTHPVNLTIGAAPPVTPPDPSTTTVDPISRDNVKGIGGTSSLFNITTIGAGTGSIDTAGKYTYSGVITILRSSTLSGHIYIPPSTIISSSAFVAADAGKVCARGEVIPSDFADSVALPDGVSNITAYGFGSSNGLVPCIMTSVGLNQQQRDVDKVLQVVLYDQAGKHGYSYDRHRNITTAQYIAPCDTTNFNNATKDLRNNVKMCYADVGTDLVVYTKVMQFYGANETPLDPPTPDPTDPPLPAGTIKIPPPDGFPTAFRSDHIIFTTNAASNAAQMTTPKADVRYKSNNHVFGDIFIQNGTRIVSNPGITSNGACNFVVESIYRFIWSNIHSSYTPPTNVQPNLANGTRAAIDEIVAVGFHENSACKSLLHNPAAPPLITDKELRVTIYDEYDKKPYFYSKRANMTEAQQIPACSSTNYDSTTQTLKDDTKMCAGVNGTNMVIITKRFTGFYGAADTITTPATPIDLDAGGAPDPAPDPTDPPGTVTPDPNGLLTIPPLPYTPEPITQTFSISNINIPYWYITGENRTLLTTTAKSNQKVIGHIYIPDRTTPLEQNPILNATKSTCGGSIDSLAILVSNKELKKSIKGLEIPDNITPKGKKKVIAMGINWIQGTTSPNVNCKIDLEANSKHPILSTKELTFTLYNQSDKKAYYFSPRANILQAQPIPICTNSTIDTTTLTLKGDTKMCYGKHGNNMVIVTKTLTGFYGAADKVIVPITPPTSATPQYLTLMINSRSDSTTGYFSSSGSYTHSSSNTTGDIYIPPNTKVLSNPVLYDGVSCTLAVNTLKDIPPKRIQDLKVPGNMKPKQKDKTIAIGFDLYLGNKVKQKCSPDLEKPSIYPLLTDKPLRFTLYNQSDKKPYYFSPRDDIKRAQPVPECSSTNYDFTTQTLKGDTKMCYGVNGDHLVIMTKRLLGFYGAADRVNKPGPIDLDTAGSPILDRVFVLTPPDNFPDPVFTSTTVVSDAGVRTGYVTTSSSDGHTFTHSNILADRIGSIFIPSEPSIPTSNVFTTAESECTLFPVDIKAALNNNYVPGLAIPDNIKPNTTNSLAALGFDMYNGSGKSVQCSPDLESNNNTAPLLLDKELRFTLFGKYDKTPYYISPRDNITAAQSIPACTSTTIHLSNQSLQKGTFMCYGTYDDHIVIITKRLSGFYGAADTVNGNSANASPDMDEIRSRDNIKGIGTQVPFRITTEDKGKATIEVSGKYTYSPAGTTQMGHIYIPPSTTISNDLFVAADKGKACVLGYVLSSEYTPSTNAELFTLPDDVSDGIAYGFGYSANTLDNPTGCNLNGNTEVDPPLDVDTVLQIVLYNQANKQGYSYLRTDNINTSQYVPPCNAGNFDSTTKTLIGDTKHCYTNAGDDLLVYTTIMQWYGAKPFDDDGMSTAPTFGTSPLTGEQLVTCGYKMDDTCRDITAYHVQYERDVIQTNTTHTFALKALAPNMIDSFTLAFGVPEVGSPISAAEAHITAKLAVNYTSPSYYNIVQVTVHDPNNIIDYDIANTEIARVSCSGGTLECAQVTFPDVLFRETLYHEPFVVMITDTLLYTSINYMNEGILVTGTPLNEQPTISPGITVDTGDIRPTKLVLVRTDKVNDLWADAFGNTWSRNSFGNYIIVEYAPYAGTVPVCDDINDRLCAPFKAKLDWHNQRMIELRDSLYTAYTTKAYAEIDDIFTYEFGDMDSRTRTLINLGWLTE